MSEPLQWKRDERWTGKKMCEFIAAWALQQRGRRVDPADIWNANRRGEVGHVFALLDEARRQTPCDQEGCGGAHRTSISADGSTILFTCIERER